MVEHAGVHVRRSGGRATVSLDSPHNRNALSADLLARLERALTAVADDESVRVVVLTGEGPVFCAGADLKSSDNRSMTVFTGILERIMRLPQPVVCRLNGAAPPAASG